MNDISLLISVFHRQDGGILDEDNIVQIWRVLKADILQVIHNASGVLLQPGDVR